MKLRFRGVATILFLVACGDTVAITNVFVESDGGGGDGSVDDSGLGGDGSRPDADADVEEDSGLCGNAKGPTSNRCQIDRACTSGECAVPAFLYQCFDSGGGSRPPIDGCRPMGPLQQVEQWCCPPACVRNIGSDPGCPSNGKSFFCPREADGGLAATPPNLACTKQGTSPTFEGYCCP